MNIGLFLPNWVGDACMATPAVRSIRQGLDARYRLIGIGRYAAREVFRGLPWLDEFLVYQPRSSEEIGNRRSLVRSMRQRPWEALVLFTNSLTTALLACASGAPKRIGYNRDARGWLLTQRLEAPRDCGAFSPIPAIDYYMKLAAALGCTSTDRAMEIVVGDEERHQAELLWSRLGWDSRCMTIAIHSGGARGVARNWPAGSIVSLARKLQARYDCQILLHCGPGERQSTLAIEAMIDHPRIRSMGLMSDLPLGLSKAALAKSKLLISSDSGPRHLGVALGLPVVSLFGPTTPEWTTTYNLPETILQVPLDCRPCFASQCPLQHHACMEGISVESVFQAACAKIESTSLWTLPTPQDLRVPEAA